MGFKKFHKSQRGTSTLKHAISFKLSIKGKEALKT